MIIACLLLFLFYFFDLQFSITRILLTYCKPLLCFLLGFPCSSAGKGSACNVRDLGSISGLGRSPGEGKGYPLAIPWTVRGVTKSRTRLNDFHFLQFLNFFLFLLFWPCQPYGAIWLSEVQSGKINGNEI